MFRQLSRRLLLPAFRASAAAPAPLPLTFARTFLTTRALADPAAKAAPKASSRRKVALEPKATEEPEADADAEPETPKRKRLTPKQRERRDAAAAKKKAAAKASKERAAANKKAAAAKAKERQALKKAKAAERAKARAERPQPVKRVPKEQQPPRRPQTPFLLFNAHFRANNPELLDAVREKGIGQAQRRAALAEITTAAAAAWRALPDHEKAKYAEQYARERAAYEAARAAWLANTDVATLKTINAHRRRHAQRVITLPRRSSGAPLPAYIRFAQSVHADIRAEMGPKAKLGAIAIEASRRWKALSDADKAPFVDSYKRDHAAWLAGKPEKPAKAQKAAAAA